jgi:hypothetical protein
MSEIKNFFFDPTYHQITAINMHTILLILLNIGILIGLYTKKIVSPAVTIIIFVVGIIVGLLMNFLVRWLSRNNYENIAWGVVVVLYLLHIGTGYNYVRIMADNKKFLSNKYGAKNNYNDMYDSSDYLMSPQMSSQMGSYMPQSMPPPMQYSQPMQQMQQMQPMQSQPMQSQPMQNRMQNFNNEDEE